MTTDAPRSDVRTARAAHAGRRGGQFRAPEAPVFVDRSGARRRLAMLTGSTAGALLVVGLGFMVASVFGATPLTLPGFPGHHGPGTAVVTQPSGRPSAGASTANPTPTPDATRAASKTPSVAPSPSSATGTATPTASPTPGNTHRRSPSNSPNPHSSKTK